MRILFTCVALLGMAWGQMPDGCGMNPAAGTIKDCSRVRVAEPQKAAVPQPGDCVREFDGNLFCSGNEVKVPAAPKPDPIDVPAIRSVYWCVTFTAKWCDQTFLDWDSVYSIPRGVDVVGSSRNVRPPTFNYFCEDRSRGLWPDENDPPKYWCHKPQTD